MSARIRGRDLLPDHDEVEHRGGLESPEITRMVSVATARIMRRCC